MTDKQIVDVTQCPYYKEDKTCTYLPYKTKCEGDCNWTVYKEMEEQFKRKEQECEELKAKCKKYGEINEQETKDYAELKAELEQEKAWHKTSDEISKANSKYTAKLKQTLAEIKEIIEQGVKIHDDIIVSKQILQKISEVEDE